MSICLLDGLIQQVLRSAHEVIGLNSEEKEHELIRFLFDNLGNSRAGFLLDNLSDGYPLLQSSYELIIELTRQSDKIMTEFERECIIESCENNRNFFKGIELLGLNSNTIKISGVNGTRASYTREGETLIEGQNNLHSIVVGTYNCEDEYVNTNSSYNEVFQLVITSPLEHFPTPSSYNSVVTSGMRYCSGACNPENVRVIQVSSETLKLFVSD